MSGSTFDGLRAGLSRPSGWVLLAANLALIPAVLLFDWSIFDIVFLYWAENLVIGVVNVLKMATVQPASGNSTSSWRSKLFMIPFFSLHYGGFCAGHGIFIFALFKPSESHGDTLWTALPVLLSGTMGMTLALLAGSHLFSFFTNYLGRGENRHTTLSELMAQPYSRIIVLHITIIVGGLLTQMLGDPMGLLLVLVLLKTVVDLNLHGKEYLGLETDQQVLSERR